MPLINHVYNVASIANKIKRNKTEKNLYEKVNQIIKGAATGSQDLIAEVIEIIKSEDERAVKYLEDIIAQMKAAETIEESAAPAATVQTEEPVQEGF
jgi:hypothetical protein